MDLFEYHPVFTKSLRDPLQIQIAEDHLLRAKKLNWPSRSSEEWRYTSIKSIKDYKYMKADFAQLEDGLSEESREILGQITQKNLRQLILLNDKFYADPSLTKAWPKGVKVRPISVAEFNCAHFEEHFFVELSKAYSSFALEITIPEETEIDEPLVLTHWTELGPNGSLLSTPLIKIKMGANSKAQILEVFGGQTNARYFSSGLTHIELEEGADLTYLQGHLSSETASEVHAVVCDQKQDSIYTGYSLIGSSLLNRHEYKFNLNESFAQAHQNVISIGGQNQTLDNQIEVNMLKPSCQSTQLVKQLLSGSANGVSSGKVYIAKDAQECDSGQLSQSILLSETAQANNKPQLDIFADNVKASHGASVGQLNEDEIFYLQSRGIPKAEAQEMIATGWSTEMFQHLEHSGLREWFTESALKYYQQIVRPKWKFDLNSQR